jgi:hypothetical protein
MKTTIFLHKRLDRPKHPVIAEEFFRIAQSAGRLGDWLAFLISLELDRIY